MNKKTQVIDSIISCKNIADADVVLATVGYDRTASHRKGAASGGQSIIKCLHEDIEFFDRYSKTEPAYNFNFFHHDVGNLNKLYPEDMVQTVYKEYKKIKTFEKFVFILGGEHSVSIGAFKALAEIENPAEVTIVHIDAHPDLRDSDANSNPDQSRPSKFAHCSGQRRAHEFGYRLVQVGIRSYSKEEYEYAQKNKRTIKTFEWGLEPTPKIRDIVRAIKTKKIYIDIDVDGIDPAYLPATGTPVQGGLEWYYTIELLRALIIHFQVIGAGILEVAPRPDDVRTEYGAAQLCYNMCAQYLQKKNHLKK
ncbi:agmatinase [Candidatus Kaiserbacteria bacterium]|nr:agmatinase [Candidatus Kaiserbacteria bacterium]